VRLSFGLPGSARTGAEADRPVTSRSSAPDLDHPRRDAMKKLKLEMDALRVDSFEPAESAAGKGTVQGREWTVAPQAGCGGGDNTSRINACFCTESLSCRCN
jgi:hypothetical protein